MNESGKCEEVLSSDWRIEKLLYHETDDSLIIVGDGLNIGYYAADSDGSLTEMATVWFYL